MKIRIAAVILCGVALYYGDRAFAIDGTSAQRQTFVAAVPCPSTGVKGYVYCPKKPTDGSAWVQTHDIRWAVPKCAAGFVDAWTNLQWVAVADLRAKDLAATCPPPPPAGTPPCVATFAPWSSPDARGVQTTGVVSVSPLPCQFNASLSLTDAVRAQAGHRHGAAGPEVSRRWYCAARVLLHLRRLWDVQQRRPHSSGVGQWGRDVRRLGRPVPGVRGGRSLCRLRGESGG
jgi:hypothetical protein